MEEMKSRIVRVADFVAESLEAEAARVPPGMPEYADSLLAMAKRLRQSDNPKFVRVWEDIESPEHTEPR
jgi:hypothetical protein